MYADLPLAYVTTIVRITSDPGKVVATAPTCSYYEAFGWDVPFAHTANLSGWECSRKVRGPVRVPVFSLHGRH